MKKQIALLCLLCFIVGFVADRLIVRSEVKKMETEMAAALGQLWGYEDEDAKKIASILGEQYSPEELTQLMDDFIGMGEKIKQLAYDTKLMSTLRGLSYLETLEEEKGVVAVKEKIKDQVREFYDEHKHLLAEQPASEQEENLIAVLRTIQREIQSFDKSTEIEPVTGK